MRSGVLNAGVWNTRSAARPAEREVSPRVERVQPIAGWSREKFAVEQIRGLVSRLFSPSVTPPLRQVVFSSVEPETDVQNICRRVGEVLAAESPRDVAVVIAALPWLPGELSQSPRNDEGKRAPAPRELGIQVRGNLWSLPLATDKDEARTAYLHRYLGEIRREFEYSIIAAPSCGESNQPFATAQFSDGLVLVLSAQHTRRVAALKIRNALEGARVRLLGTVLTDREFPIPEGIYRRL